MVEYLDDLESGLCLQINSLSQRVHIRKFFTAISRCGDWYAYAVVAVGCAVLLGELAPEFLTHALLTGAAGLLVYKLLKSRLVRERPYITHYGIVCGTAPLDRYSFPSGHTLHAVSFAIVFWAYLPVTVWLMAPFAVLVAASRIILGLHYPTDVLVGAAIGAVIASSGIALVF